MRELIVHACYELSYSYSVDENDIRFIYNNIISIPRKCLSGEMTAIRSKIDTVFYFSINGDTLKLYNPTGFAAFSFKREVQPALTAINGLWQTLTVYGSSQHNDISINGTHAIICDG